MATCCLTGLVGVGVHSLFTFNLQMMPFVLVTAILLAELERASNASPRFGVGLLTYPRRVLPVVSLVALLIIPIGHFGRTAAAFTYIENGSRHSARGDFTEAANAFSTARAIWGSVDAVWFLHANVLLDAMRASDHTSASQRRELVARATSLLDAAEERNPFRAKTHLIRGLLRADHPELTSGSAEDALRTAVRMNPRNVEARYALSQVVARDGRRDEALRILNEGHSINYGNSINSAPLRDRAAALTNLSRSAPLENGSGIDSTTESDRIKHR
jgi:tetratricopeptide (TPR) repeat protein